MAIDDEPLSKAASRPPAGPTTTPAVVLRKLRRADRRARRRGHRSANQQLKDVLGGLDRDHEPLAVIEWWEGRGAAIGGVEVGRRTAYLAMYSRQRWRRWREWTWH